MNKSPDRRDFQSKSGRRIPWLEAELGVSLFERTSRRVTLTPGGLVFREEAREMRKHRSA